MHLTARVAADARNLRQPEVRALFRTLLGTCSPCPVRGERRGDVTSTGVLFGRRQPPRSSEATSPIAAR